MPFFVEGPGRRPRSNALQGTLGPLHVGGRKPPFDPLFAKDQMGVGVWEDSDAASGRVSVILGGHFNAFFHSGILFIQIPIRPRPPLSASAS